MTHPNAQLIERFYQAFQRLDGECMAACYSADAQFSDPVFPALQGAQIGDMWRMLSSRAKDFSLSYASIEADGDRGRARWVASYTFTRTGRRVVNHIQAQFEFRDGLICRHVDSFDLWAWSRQALGARGMLLGWAPPVQAAIRAQAASGLASYRAQREAKA
ncbi:nuclear transport factor 2 family protein [Pseudomonas sp. ZM23]|uniref:Nuclear transport factor 2 family protein n=1 Tax=Pseudomonas triclosanedens TaxID=2961893 RepID=A0ABY6ZUI1_9PSED|nr:nuclear transport factor 2 family protein [Pseudomonas triclosanedens]MCP8463337.1 nuclear transport factor 2 family protein [Pseudomonas triclosanedens]MCP8469604.1 nuclear transport factor 2 family protein [Pseudomonas triclosanedens]MCP8474138.1 nuclear transport factor 2 family protein [Pseudomonas triclosanedens]WAI48471.1 nuclear transport factor 2 family protein [Pseudomonas triclosanedens]